MHRLDDLVGKRRNVEVVLAPTMLAVQPLHLQVQHHHFNLAAQNFYWRDHQRTSRKTPLANQNNPYFKGGYLVKTLYNY